MDQQKLRILVFEKTGVKIDVDDPVFALVALNEAVLAEAVERHVALLDDATRELAGQVQALQDGGHIERPAVARPAPAPVKPAGAAALTDERRVIAIAGGAALLGAVLVLLGQGMFFRPSPTPAPIVQAKELTAEQTKALADADKMARAVEKLDPKSRKLIQSEMQKP
jgi:Tfp pilus assembly protein PilN